MTKEQIIAERSISTERYILSTLPTIYLPLHSVDGSPFISRDGHGYVCTVTDAVRRFHGLYYNGSSAMITIPDHADLKLGTSNFTLEAWIKPTSFAAHRQILSKRTGAIWYDFRTLQTTGVLRLDITGSDYVAGTTNVCDDTWRHVVATRDYAGDVGEIYVNGNPEGAQTGNVNQDVTNTEMLSIGRLFLDPNEYYWFLGGMGEVRIYKRLLSGVDVINNYQATQWRYL